MLFYGYVEEIYIQDTDLDGAIPVGFCTMLEEREDLQEFKYSSELIFKANCQKITCQCCTDCCERNVGNQEQCTKNSLDFTTTDD